VIFSFSDDGPRIPDDEFPLTEAAPTGRENSSSACQLMASSLPTDSVFDLMVETRGSE
jgi:hypothetical protein